MCVHVYVCNKASKATTHGLQQILLISHITGSLWALSYLENRQQFGEEGLEHGRGKCLARHRCGERIGPVKKAVSIRYVSTDKIGYDTSDGNSQIRSCSVQ